MFTWEREALRGWDGYFKISERDSQVKEGLHLFSGHNETNEQKLLNEDLRSIEGRIYKKYIQKVLMKNCQKNPYEVLSFLSLKMSQKEVD